MNNSNTIGKRIKLLRKELGLTQEEFGKKIYRVKSIISKIESDEVDLSSSNRLAICKVFGIREDWILKGEGEMKDDLRDIQVLLDESMNVINSRGGHKHEYGNSKVLKTYNGKKLVRGHAQVAFLLEDALAMCERILQSETPHAITLYIIMKNLDLVISDVDTQ